MNSWNIVRTRCPLLIALTFFLSGCTETRSGELTTGQSVIPGNDELFEPEAAARMLQNAFGELDTSNGNSSIKNASPYVYAEVAYSPLWITEEGIKESAHQLLADLDSLRNDGIDPERYRLKELTASFKKLQSGSSAAEAIAFDTACTAAYLLASHDLLLGLLVPRRADSLWFHSNDSSWDAPRLLAAMNRGSAYPSLSRYRSAIPTYRNLREAFRRYKDLQNDATLSGLQTRMKGKATPDSIVAAIVQKVLPWVEPDAADSLSPKEQFIRAFQQHFGAPATGKLDSSTARLLSLRPDTIARRIAANMERLRWMPRTLAAQHVFVNIPLMELFYRRDGYDAFHMRVVVGKPSRQTPALDAAMANVVFSPAWGVPPTILKKDVMPGFSKSGAAYLRKKGLHLYDKRGRPVSAAGVSAKNLRNYTLRQPPGARNALGEVKFNLPNRWDIYLHDTPHREDFPKRYRAKSSGCVRVERPREFAEFILRDLEGRDRFDQFTIDSIIQTRKTRYEILKNKIAVHIVYLTAQEDSTGAHIRLVPDIYGRDAKLMAMLSR